MSFNMKELKSCIAEAERFITRAKQCLADADEYERQNVKFKAMGGFDNPKAFLHHPYVHREAMNRGACKRASLDLSRELATLRRRG